MSNSTPRPSGGAADARADDSQQLALLDHGAALDGEVIPPEAAPAKIYFPSPAEMEELFGEVNTALAALERTTVEKAAEVGQVLIRVKERFAHGSWLNYLESHTGLKRRAAANYMLLASAKQELPARKWATVANMGVRAALTELSRRKREEQEAEREEREEKEEVRARIPAPVQRDDPEAGPPTGEIKPRAYIPYDSPEDKANQLCLLVNRIAEDIVPAITPEKLLEACTVRHLNNLNQSLSAATEFLVRLREYHECPNPMAAPGDLSVQPHAVMLKEFLVWLVCFQHEHPEANDDEIAFALNRTAGLVRGGLLGRARKDAGLAEESDR